MRFARRLQPLQANVFAEMDAAKARARSAGQPIIDLSLGSTDRPAPERALAAIEGSLRDPGTHGYTLFHDTQTFREAVARWYERKYGLAVDAETEVLLLIGCQEGTAHLPLALLDPGSVALLQDPGYPSHAGGVRLADGEIYRMPTLAENDFLPQLEAIPQAVLERARMMVLSYPHNPTTATAPLSFFQRAVAFCRDWNLALVHDFPYADFVYDGRPAAPSALQADPARERTIEFFTLSKSFNMGGFRVAYAIGNAELIAALQNVKSAIDFNQYRGIINGAIAALEGSQAIVQDTVAQFQQRRDALVGALHRVGWPVPAPAATLYVWALLPAGWPGTAMQFCTQLVAETGVAAAPGSGFGERGEGYVRLALVRDPATLEEAAQRIGAFLASHRAESVRESV